MHDITFGAVQYYFILGLGDIFITIVVLILLTATTRRNSLFIVHGLITLVNLALFAQDEGNTSREF